MFRITATPSAGHDMAGIVFTIYAPNVAVALMSAMRAMIQLGFADDQYTIAHSLNLKS